MVSEIANAIMVSSVMKSLALIFVGLIFVIVLIRVFQSPISYRYRKHLTNLYIASKIRQLADKDKINLVDEERRLELYVKKIKADSIKELDEQIEFEAMQKINEGLDIKE